MPLIHLPTAMPVQPPGLAGAQVEWLKWPLGGPGRGDSGSRWGKSRAAPGQRLLVPGHGRQAPQTSGPWVLTMGKCLLMQVSRCPPPPKRRDWLGAGGAARARRTEGRAGERQEDRE